MVTQNAVKSMVAGGSDNCIVLNVNSVLGLQRTKFTMRHRSLYIGSKHAITGIAAALRGEICEKGLGDKIRVMVGVALVVLSSIGVFASCYTTC